MNLTLALTIELAPAVGQEVEPEDRTFVVTTDLAPAVGDEVEPEDPGTSFARCSDGHGTLSRLFFSDDDHELARAKAICRTCGLRDACLAGAIERQEPYGVWGGMLVLDGNPVEFQRRRGRPGAC